MRDAEPRAISLKEYQVPDFLIDKTHLHFELHPDSTKVTSELKMRRNPQSDHKDAELVMHGQDIALKSISIDGRILTDKEYRVDAESLTVFSCPMSLHFR